MSRTWTCARFWGVAGRRRRASDLAPGEWPKCSQRFGIGPTRLCSSDSRGQPGNYSGCPRLDRLGLLLDLPACRELRALIPCCLASMSMAQPTPAWRQTPVMTPVLFPLPLTVANVMVQVARANLISSAVTCSCVLRLTLDLAALMRSCMEAFNGDCSLISSPRQLPDGKVHRISERI